MAKSFVFRQGRKSSEGVAANKLADEIARDFKASSGRRPTAGEMRRFRVHAKTIIESKRK